MKQSTTFFSLPNHLARVPAKLCLGILLCATNFHGVSVSAENFPQGDTNLLQIDSDRDGISDFLEGTEDSDGDGIANYLDTDSDNDGISDRVETRQILKPMDPVDSQVIPFLSHLVKKTLDKKVIIAKQSEKKKLWIMNDHNEAMVSYAVSNNSFSNQVVVNAPIVLKRLDKKIVSNRSQIQFTVTDI